MKSVVIKQNNKMIIHIKQTKKGVEAVIENNVKNIKITCVMDNNKRIII